MSNPGIFIAIEGIDGSGGTTQSQLLYEELQRAHPTREVVLTREPSATPITTLIRKWMSPGSQDMPSQAVCLAFVLDRYVHLETVIKPALGRNAIIVCDRYKMSTLAYQIAGGVNKEFVTDLIRPQLDPDLYILIDLPVDVAMKRVRKRITPPDKFEEDREFQTMVVQRYHHEFVSLDGIQAVGFSAENMSVLKLQDEIRKAVRRLVDV